MRPVLRSALPVFLFIVVAVVVRGVALAHLLGGHYRISSAAIDIAGLSALMLLCHAGYAAVRWSAKKIIPGQSLFIRFLRQSFSVLFVVFIVFPLLLVMVQMHPQKIAPARTPLDFGAAFELVTLQSENLTLRGWLLGAAGEKSPLLLLHGLNANKDNFLPIAVKLAGRGFPVLIFDLRGHGESDGHQMTFGLKEYRDVVAGYDWLQIRYPNRKIVAVGYSLGGAALLHAASKYRKFDRIVLDSTFANIEDVANEAILKYLGPLRAPIWQIGNKLIQLLYGIHLADADMRPAVAALDPEKVFLVHCRGDKLIPPQQSEKLREATGNNAALWLVDGRGHLGSINDPEYFNRIGSFLAGENF